MNNSTSVPVEADETVFVISIKVPTAFIVDDYNGDTDWAGKDLVTSIQDVILDGDDTGRCEARLEATFVGFDPNE